MTTTRNRSRGSLFSQSYQGSFSTYTNAMNCSVAPSWSSSYSNYSEALGTVKVMTDSVVPRFHERVKKGEVFFNPMYSREYTIHPAQGVDGWCRSITTYCTGTAHPFQLEWRFSNAYMSTFSLFTTSTVGLAAAVSETDVSSAITEASTSVLSERGRAGTSNLYESLAEYEQLLRLLPGVFSSMRTALLAKNVLSRAKAAGGAYLAYRYGIKPFISDVEQILTGMDARTGRQRFSSRSNLSLSGTVVSTSSGVFGGMQNYTRTQTLTENVEVRAMSLDEYYVTQLDNLGLAFKNLATVPWELVPFSFVADWFANVGDLIGSLVPSPGVNQLGGCVTVKRSRLLDVRDSNAQAVSGTTNVVPYSARKSATDIIRSRGGLVCPGFVIRSNFRFDHITRSLDAISLLLQQIRR